MKLRMLIGILLLVAISLGVGDEAKAQGYYYGPRRGTYYYRSYRPVYTMPPYGRAYGYYYRPRPVYRPYGYYRGYYPAYRAYYHRHNHW